MLATFRQGTRHALPLVLPCHSRRLATLNTTTLTTEKSKAMEILALDGNTESQTAVAQRINSPPNFDDMHHHIPPEKSPLLHFMTTLLMRHGQYAKAAKVTNRMLLHIHALTRSPPMPIVEKAIEIVSPAVRSRKMKQGGGKTKYLPQALNERQRTRLGIKWIIDEVDLPGKPGKSLAERMARQIIATINGHEATRKLKQDMHGIAMVNRGSLPKR